MAQAVAGFGLPAPPSIGSVLHARQIDGERIPEAAPETYDEPVLTRASSVWYPAQTGWFLDVRTVGDCQFAFDRIVCE